MRSSSFTPALFLTLFLSSAVSADPVFPELPKELTWTTLVHDDVSDDGSYTCSEAIFSESVWTASPEDRSNSLALSCTDTIGPRDEDCPWDSGYMQQRLWRYDLKSYWTIWDREEEDCAGPWDEAGRAGPAFGEFYPFWFPSNGTWVKVEEYHGNMCNVWKVSSGPEYNEENMPYHIYVWIPVTGSTVPVKAVIGFDGEYPFNIDAAVCLTIHKERAIEKEDLEVPDYCPAQSPHHSPAQSTPSTPPTPAALVDLVKRGGRVGRVL